MRATPARQTFPRWRVTRQAGEAAPRGATVIPFPVASARRRAVVTYPRALILPDRRVEPAPLTARTLRGLGLAAGGAALLGLVALVLA